MYGQKITEIGFEKKATILKIWSKLFRNELDPRYKNKI